MDYGVMFYALGKTVDRRIEGNRIYHFFQRKQMPSFV